MSDRGNRALPYDDRGRSPRRGDRSPPPRHRSRSCSMERGGRRWSPERRGGDFGGRGRGRRDDGGGDRGRGRGRGRRFEPSDDGGGGRERWGKPGEFDDEEEVPEKEPEPDFGLSGALAAETNTVNGVVLVHNEPSEARPPTARWRLYVFKNGEPFEEPLHVHRQSRYLFGRERKIADIPTDHPSCSKQHAVLQFRLTEKEGADGMMVSAVRPYLLDLGSTNGTFLNGDRLEEGRYYELLEKDMLRFGNSSREYVLLKEK